MVCDFWACKHFEDCKVHCVYSGAKYPPCACCVRFDMCDSCTRFVECAELVTRYLPQMFRRLVLDIRHGEDTQRAEQYIRRNTRGGKRS